MVYTHSQTLEHIRLLNKVLHPTPSKHCTLVRFFTCTLWYHHNIVHIFNIAHVMHCSFLSSHFSCKSQCIDWKCAFSFPECGLYHIPMCLWVAISTYLATRNKIYRETVFTWTTSSFRLDAIFARCLDVWIQSQTCTPRVYFISYFLETSTIKWISRLQEFIWLWLSPSQSHIPICTPGGFACCNHILVLALF